MQVADQDDGGRRRTAGGISLQTLLIASVASVVTSYVVSRLWGPGTLIGAGATPVIVALVAESLRKPVQTVAATAQRVPVAQYVPVVRDRARAQPDPDAPTRVATAEEDAPTRVVGLTEEPPTRVVGEPRPREPAGSRHAAPPPVDPGYVVALDAEPLDAPPRPRREIRWGLVLATAAAAFAIVVAVYTIPDLVAGKSITGSGRATTLFGGSSSRKATTKQDDSTTTSTKTEKPKTVTSTAPAATTTVPAPTSTATTPTSTTPPPVTTTPPATTTAPAPTTPAVPPAPGTTTPAVP